MFNSCPFNAVKYNSVCVKEVVIPPIIPSGGKFRERKKRLFVTQFFPIIGIKLLFNEELIDIIGKKLIFNKQFNDIIGVVLLLQKSIFDLRGEKLTKSIEDLLIEGKAIQPFKIEKEIVGFVQLGDKKKELFAVTGAILLPISHRQGLRGLKLVNQLTYKEIKGLKSVLEKQSYLIKGRKDISEILEVLDLLDMDE